MDEDLIKPCPDHTDLHERRTSSSTVQVIGPRVMTAKGLVSAEDLRVGDMVLTRSNKYRAIRWISMRTVVIQDDFDSRRWRPIVIPRGVLGNNAPNIDFYLSAHQRLVLDGPLAELYGGKPEVFVPASALIGHRSIWFSETVVELTCVQISFDHHEQILVEGVWVECYVPEPSGIVTATWEQRDEILEVFPELADRSAVESWTSAPQSMSRHETLLLLASGLPVIPANIWPYH